MGNHISTSPNAAAPNATGTDDVELKVTVPEAKASAAREKFNLHCQQGQQRRIWFYDIRTLDLFHRGVVLRAREIYGDEHDSTVKFRPVDPESVPSKWRKLPGFKIEADGVGGKLIPSASLTIPQGKTEIVEVAAKKRAIEKLFSPDQELFLKEMSLEGVEFQKLAILGPTEAHRWKFKDPGLPFEITAEEWRLPNGRDLLEFSIKVQGAATTAAAAGFNAFLNQLGFGADANQQTKTRVALEYFAGTS